MDSVTDWTGKPCPKCGYVRAPLDLNPAWQCPRCGVAYNKALALACAAPVRAQLAAHAGAMAARASGDNSLAGLLAVNALAIALALALHMSLRDLMLVYWIQSVIIGLSNVVRILRLHEFSTEGFRINDQPVEPTAGTKYRTAGFFALHYGFFHAVYLAFILAEAKAGPLAAPGVYAVLAIAFAVNHLFSLRHNLASDAAGRPNIGTLMFMPYIRIFPMHLTIIFGLGFFGGAGTVPLLIFGLLKTAADALMHLAEHHLLAAGKPIGGAIIGPP